MAEAIANRPWTGRISFVVLFAGLVVVSILPLDTMPPVWVGPDPMLAVTLVWVVRRPDLVPLPVIAALWFMADLVLQRPPGLMAALVVLLTEALRSRNTALRSLPFVLEWLSVSAGIIAIALAQRIVLTVLMTPQAPLGLSLLQMVMTMLAWPVAALLARVFFGITKAAPGEVDALGKPL